MKIKKNGKVIRLSESDLKKIVKRVLSEQEESDTISSKELKKLGRKGWNNLLGNRTISMLEKMSDNFIVVDSHGKIESAVDMHAMEKVKQLGIDSRKILSKLIKKDGDIIRIKYVIKP